MTHKSEVPVPGIDLTFRPATYFWPLGLETHLLARIKGVERKAALLRLIDAGRLDEIPDFLAQSTLDNEDRQALAGLHPAFMGGEYLPDIKHEEVEIARITIRSVTQDVTSVFARRGKSRIYLRVVDEYDGGTLAEKCTCTSTRPLTLGQLEKFLNGAWSIFENLAMNFGREGYRVDDMLAFERVASPFYRQIGALYDHRIEVWAAERRRELGLDREDGDKPPRDATGPSAESPT